jgi:hypothetical protein
MTSQKLKTNKEKSAADDCYVMQGLTIMFPDFMTSLVEKRVCITLYKNLLIKRLHQNGH